ncbi:MAG: hypothetical protein AAFX90_04135 [Pseudomonadota bacterium]
MILIFNALLLSIGVFLRMIVPVLLISLASIPVWFVLSLVTLGMASHVSGPITTMFISLFGIRVALAVKGDRRRTEFKTLALYSALYGIFIAVVLAAITLVAGVVALIFTLWQLGEPISFGTINEAMEQNSPGFFFLAFGSNVTLIFVLLAAGYSAMAVPMASAARGAGHGAPSRGFLNGFGRSFIPLFCIFLVAILLQFAFEIFTFLLAQIPLFLSIFSIVLTGEFPDFDLQVILKGLASCAVLLWINALMWSASALALLKFEGNETPRTPTPTANEEPAPDIRALRKSRERSL